MTIAKLTLGEEGDPQIGRFMNALVAEGFEGDIDRSHATRTVLSTDNSIYQRYPTAVLFPRNTLDVQRIARLLGRSDFGAVVAAPRGGGTGTNGQSLSEGLVVDLSKHMNRIVEIDPIARTAKVEAGVVKDQLNAALKKHGLFFAPELSTSNRATIGGMVNTDASGQGSCTYGKTRDHVLSLETILIGGERLCSAPIGNDELDGLCARKDRVGHVYQVARDICENQADDIRERFPRLNRCLTGYDLAHLRNSAGRFDLNSLLCGSEGTLGFMVEATLNLLPIPAYAALVIVRYVGFMDALRDARALMTQKPLSIETVDSTILQLAREDTIWDSVAKYFPSDRGGDEDANGINLVEFCAESLDELNDRLQAFSEHLNVDDSVKRIGHGIAWGDTEINRVYAMRKRAVGLLGNLRGESRPQPFVEDTAVPPENLASYISEFRSLLDGLGLRYGMFGHVDAGVLHVRPALDMRNPEHAALIRPISDAVVALTMKYGGLLWGEHGKGVRSEYVPEFFGPLYPSLQRIKAAFDPNNQLNPGKIATPVSSTAKLLRIDTTPMRGESDRLIDERIWQENADAVHCNGNGACYNFDPNDAMCPSWKATRERIHSPKGRASLMREWLRLQSEAGTDLAGLPTNDPLHVRATNTFSRMLGEKDFSHQVYDAMAGCLACKSCAGQCPVKVNVPEFRSRFLALYHTRYLRPIRDYMVASLEFVIPWVEALPGGKALYNLIIQATLSRFLFKKMIGIVDNPALDGAAWRRVIRSSNVQLATPQRLASLNDAERLRSVILVQDAFTRYFDTPIAIAFIELAARLGFSVFVAPYMANGKPMHVHGFLRAFHRSARRNAAQLSALGRCGIRLVGLDPAMTLVYRQEYLKVPEICDVPTVLLPQEWLVDALRLSQPLKLPSAAFRLLPHCTERTNALAATKLWTDVFEASGLTLSISASGCCGMSGTYGHEVRNRATSEKIFEQSWGPHLDVGSERSGAMQEGAVLASGYSCRCQVKRLRGRRLPHPLEALRDAYMRGPDA